MKIIKSIRSLQNVSEKEFLALFLTCFSTSFLIAAPFMPDWQDTLPGLLRILSQPTKGSTNFFSVGGYAATFSTWAWLA